MATWYKNKNTSLVWEVEGGLAERLSRNPDYEKVEVPLFQQPLVDENDLTNYTVAKLREIAADKGVEGVVAMKKVELIAALSGDDG